MLKQPERDGNKPLSAPSQNYASLFLTLSANNPTIGTEHISMDPHPLLFCCFTTVPECLLLISTVSPPTRSLSSCRQEGFKGIRP